MRFATAVKLARRQRGLSIKRCASRLVGLTPGDSSSTNVNRTVLACARIPTEPRAALYLAGLAGPRVYSSMGPLQTYHPVIELLAEAQMEARLEP